jgi:hypothetical protein
MLMAYQGAERRSTHECIQVKDIEELKNDMKSNRNLKSWLASIIVVILVQIGTFLYLWGGMNEIVAKNTDYIWNDLTPEVRQTTRNVDKILAKLDHIKIISVVDNAGR